ncbi:MAG: CNNM domain-containing protein [Verrucomicrobiaceae bacterium]|nr:CNNM domain-containing protein [Verrucomicrobiaceae bacterium]
MTLLVSGLIYLSLLLLLAAISATEAAILTTREIGAGALAAQSERVRRQIQSITSNPFPHLHRALLLSAALNLALAALGLFLVTGPLFAAGLNPWLSAAALFVASLFIGDIAPKFFALRSPAEILIGSTRLLKPVRVILDPLIAVVERVSEMIVRSIVPKKIKMRQPITQEELETLIEMREEQGALDEAEAAIIREILDVAALTVRDCMVPRVNLPLLAIADIEEKGADVLEHAESRFVVVHGDTPDAVHGVIDTHAWKLAGRPAILSRARPPVFVPETLPAMEALEKHLGGSARCVLVVDEYGGLEGMVSQDEIVDWLLYDAAPWQGEGVEIRDLGGGRYLMDGTTRLDHIADELSVTLEAEGIDTIGGFVFTQLGHLPKPGERVNVNGIDLKVRRVSRTRVQQVEMRLPEKKEPEPAEEDVP